MSARAWVQAARPLAHANIATPLVVGECLAWAITGQFDLWLVALTHLAGVLDQLFIVFANDVADEAGDRDNTDATPFSGGSRVLAEGKLTSSQLRNASVAAAAALLALAAVMSLAFARPLLFPLWVLGIALLWAYSYAPLRLSYRGYGELAQGLGLGVVLPLIGYYTVAGELQTMRWEALAPLFLLGFAGNINTALPDKRSDERCNKATWPVRFGLARARKNTLQILAIAVLMTPWVLPSMDSAGWFRVEAVPLAVIAIAVFIWRDAAADDRRGCVRFVFTAAAALNAVMIAWCIALWVGAV